MVYDLSNPLQKEQFLVRAALLAKRGGWAELTDRRQRSLSQNAYLHAMLSYFALQYGETMEYVKENYYKRLVNPALFVREKDDPFLGRAQEMRSSASLSAEEMRLSIDRFRDWSAKEAGIYLPSPEDAALVRQMEMEAERGRALT